MFTLREKVLWFALFSRAFVLLLSAVSNLVIPDHDAGVFVSPRNLNAESKSIGDSVIELLFGGLARWDAQYFLHIAAYGYTYENCLAFFPLFPLTVRALSNVVHYLLGGAVGDFSVLLLTSVVVNVLFFVKSALALYDLSLQVLKDEKLAYKAAILFSVNPASIFFTAPYSESLFSFFSFYGMLKCVHCTEKSGFAVICGFLFGLSGAARSNGILNIGFIAHKWMKHFVSNIITVSKRKLQAVKSEYLLVLPVIIMPVLVSGVLFVISSLLTLVPFICFQMYSYQKFCVVHKHNLPQFIVDYAQKDVLWLPGLMPDMAATHWCNAKLPLAYSYVQDHYWNVGFMRYYTWKQIPNFLLALPVVTIIISQSWKYFQQNRYQCLTFDLMKQAGTNSHVSAEKRGNNSGPNFNPNMYVYLVHALFLAVFCTLCIHVQVTTRLIASASPVLYWLAAGMCTLPTAVERTKDVRTTLTDRFRRITNSRMAEMHELGLSVESVENLRSRWKVFILYDTPSNRTAKFIKYYFLSYMFVGTVLFSNFYPWT